MPQPATAPDAGLFTTTAEPVPLTGVSIDVEITTFCGRVVVTQRYVNRESTPIEATYLFPLDEGAAVCGFEALIDGTLVVGEVKERDEAFRQYDDAIERGDGAFLLDEPGGGFPMLAWKTSGRSSRGWRFVRRSLATNGVCWRPRPASG
jgi:hypothetical protein